MLLLHSISAGPPIFCWWMKSNTKKIMAALYSFCCHICSVVMVWVVSSVLTLNPWGVKFDALKGVKGILSESLASKVTKDDVLDLEEQRLQKDVERSDGTKASQKPFLESWSPWWTRASRGISSMLSDASCRSSLYTWWKVQRQCLNPSVRKLARLHQLKCLRTSARLMHEAI